MLEKNMHEKSTENSTDKLKCCPFCGKKPVPTYANKNRFCCPTNHCPNAYYSFAKEQWDTRPIEDALCKELEEWKMDAERLARCLNGILDSHPYLHVRKGEVGHAIKTHRELVEKEGNDKQASHIKQI
jgi:hypothetical protein